MPKSSYVASHVRVTSTKAFAEVSKAFERQLGKYDPAALQLSSPDDAAQVRARLEAMAGASGFMLFGGYDHGALLTLFGEPRKAMQYVVGNPLFAMRMTRRKLAAGLYAPLRVFISEDANETVVEYDTASSLFGQFGDPDVSAVAAMLDQKMDALVAASI
jgi:uncharacterized protein (DUF302 family)